MHATVDRKRIRIVLAMFLSFAISGFLLGHFGLQAYNNRLTLLSAGVFGIGIFLVFLCLVYPFKWDGFWFSYILLRLGRIGWLRRFGISQPAEGAINLTLLQTISGIFIGFIVGQGSYMFNDASTIVYSFFTYSWLYFAMHLHYKNMKDLPGLSKIIEYDQKTSFETHVKRTISIFNRVSVGLLILGVILFATVTTLWIDPQDDVQSRLTFYVRTTWEGPPTFAMVYPAATIPYYTIKLTAGLAYGIVAVIGGLILATTILLLWLTSDEIQATVDIYDPDCLKPAEQLLNTFWLLTSAGLLLVPYMTAFSLNLQGAGHPLAARWANYISWTYIICFVGILIFSMAKYYSFVTAAKNLVDQQIRRELKDALEPEIDREKLTAAKMKMRLLSSFKGRPTLGTLLQLLQIIAIILLNVLIKMLE